MTADVARLVVALEARTTAFEKAMNRAHGVAQKRSRDIAREFQGLNRNISKSLRLDPIAAGMSSVGLAAANAARHSARLTAGMSSVGVAGTAAARGTGTAAASTNLLAAASARATAALAGMRTALMTSAASASMAGTGFGAAIAGVSGYLVVGKVTQYADSWTRVTRALEANEEVFGMRLRSAEQLNQSANEARADLDAFSKLYFRTAAATRELGIAEEDVAKATKTVAMSLKLGSASAGEQASTMLQLSQALQKGKLDGDEFRAVMENAGVIQELLADKLKVSKGEIIKMAAAGRLQVPQLIGALLDGAEKVERIFKGMPTTIDEALTVLDNKTSQWIGQLNEAYGASQMMVDALALLANNVETVGNGAIVLATALAAAFAPRMILGILAAGAGVAAVAGPLGLIAGAVTGGAVAFSLFADKVGTSSDGVTTLEDHVHALVDVVSNDLTEAFAWFGRSALDNLDKVKEKADETADSTLFSLLTKVLDAAKILTVGTEKLLDLFKIEMISLGDSIADSYYQIFNAVQDKIQSFVNWSIDSLNWLIEKANQVPGVKMDSFTKDPANQEPRANPYAGSEKRAAERRAEFARDLPNNFWTRLDQTAQEKALGRGFARSTQVQKEIEAKPRYPGGTDEDAQTAKAQARFDKTLSQLESSIEMRRLEAENIGKSAFEIERLATRQELLNKARELGVQLTKEDMIAIDALSAANAYAVTEAEALRNAFDEIRQSSEDTLKGFLNDLVEGTSATEALGNALKKIQSRLIDMAVNDLVAVALGGLTGQGGDPQGPGMGAAVLKMFGFAKGGVAANGRPLPMFAKGGVTRSAAIFGEAGPEAAVPLPDGRRIPVDLRMPNTAAQQQAAPTVNFTANFQVSNGTPEGIEKLKSEMVPLIKGIAQNELRQAFDRSPRFARSGI